MLRLFILIIAMASACATAFAQSGDKDWQACAGDDDDIAIRACTRIINAGRVKGKDLGTVYYNRGLSLRRKDEFDRAIADYTKALQYIPNDSKVFNNRGVAYELKRQFDLAIADYERAMKLAPADPKPYSNRGDVHRKRGDYKQAIADYSRAISLDPTRAIEHSDLAEVYMLTGQFDLALANAARSVELDRNRSAGYFARGLSAFYQGEYRTAAPDLRRALDLRTSPYTIMYRYLARARAGETATAELEADAKRLESKAWPYALIEMLIGHRDPAAVSPGADDISEKCDAHYFTAQLHAVKGNTADYLSRLRSAADVCPKTDYESMGAKAELQRISK